MANDKIQLTKYIQSTAGFVTTADQIAIETTVVNQGAASEHTEMVLNGSLADALDNINNLLQNIEVSSNSEDIIYKSATQDLEQVTVKDALDNINELLLNYSGTINAENVIYQLATNEQALVTVKDVLDSVGSIGTPYEGPIYYLTVEEYNEAKGTNKTQLEFNNMTQLEKIKESAKEATGFYKTIDDALSDLDASTQSARTSALAAAASQVVATNTYELSLQYLTRLNSALSNSLQTIKEKETALVSNLNENIDKIDNLSELADKLLFKFANEDDSLISGVKFAVIPENAFLGKLLDGETDSDTIYFCYNPEIEDTTEDGDDIYYTVNASVFNNQTNGAVGGSGHYPVDALVNLYAVANEGYEFTSWVDLNEEIVSTSNPYSFVVDGRIYEYNYFAKFTQKQNYKFVNVISSDYNAADISIVDSNNNESKSLYVVLNSTATIKVTINDTTKYRFVELYNNVNNNVITIPTNLVLSGDTIVYTFTPNILLDITYTAKVISTEYINLTLSANPEYAGEIIGGTVYKKGNNTILILAVPDMAGWFEFVNWNSGETDNPLIKTNVDSDKNYVANFQLVALLALSLTPATLAPSQENNTLSITTTASAEALTKTITYYIVAFNNDNVISNLEKTFDVDLTANTSSESRVINGSLSEITEKGFTYSITYSITLTAAV